MSSPPITRPKYPLLFSGGHRFLFPALVQLGNEIVRRSIPLDQIGEIQIFNSACVWKYRVFENPYYFNPNVKNSIENENQAKKLS